MLIISDLHWRCDTPSWRAEKDYSAEVLRPQLQACFDTGHSVVVAGDVFHRAADFDAAYDLLAFLKDSGAVLYAVRGQHDMIDHAGVQSATGFNLLAKAGVIVPLGAEPVYEGGVYLYGMGWGEAVPGTLYPDSILVAHVSVRFGAENLPDFEPLASFRDRTKHFRWVFTGDNHIRGSGLGVYNAGCFHQMTADLENQAPAAWKFVSSDFPPCELWSIPCKPPVVNIARRGQEKGRAAAGAEFAEALDKARNSGGSAAFVDALAKAAVGLNEFQAELLREIVRKCKESHV